MKNLLLIFLFISFISTAQNSVSVSGGITGSRGTTIEYSCDVVYRLHKFATY